MIIVIVLLACSNSNGACAVLAPKRELPPLAFPAAPLHRVRPPRLMVRRSRGTPQDADTTAPTQEERRRRGAEGRARGRLLELFCALSSSTWSSWVGAEDHEDPPNEAGRDQWRHVDAGEIEERQQLKALDGPALEIAPLRKSTPPESATRTAAWFLNLVQLQSAAKDDSPRYPVHFFVCLATKSQGASRLVQLVLEAAVERQEEATWHRRNEMACKLAGFTEVLLVSMHGHHVLQVLSELPIPRHFAPQQWCRYLVLRGFLRDRQAEIDRLECSGTEVTQNEAVAAIDMALLTNCFASRVLEKLVQNCSLNEELGRLLDIVTERAMELMKTQFGNFIVTKVLTKYPHCALKIGRKMGETSPDNLVAMAMDKYPSYMLEALFSTLPPAGTIEFFTQLLESDKVVAMACSESSAAVLCRLDVTSDDHGPLILKLGTSLRPERRALEESGLKAGRKVIERFGLDAVWRAEDERLLQEAAEEERLAQESAAAAKAAAGYTTTMDSTTDNTQTTDCTTTTDFSPILTNHQAGHMSRRARPE